MNKNHGRSLRSGFLNISLAAILAGMTVVGSFIAAEIAHLTNQSPSAQTALSTSQTTSPTETSTTNILPPSSINPITTPTTVPTDVYTTAPTVQVQTQTPTSTATAAVSPVLTAKDCGTDANCLIASAKTCGPSKGAINSTLLIPGISETISNTYIISPLNAVSCLYSSTTTMLSATIGGQKPSTTVQTALNKIVGTGIECSVPSSTIIQTITDASQNIMSAKDLSATSVGCTAVAASAPTATTH